MVIRPDARRRGFGTAAYEELVGAGRRDGPDQARQVGWDHERTRGFAAARGWEQKSIAVNRRQHLRELEPGLAERLYDEAVAHAGDYELARIEAARPAELLEALAVATAAINDAPLDDLDIEDEVFTADRVAAYENTQIASGHRFYRVIARHRGSGDIAGLTVVTVDSETPRRASRRTRPSSARIAVTGSACC